MFDRCWIKVKDSSNYPNKGEIDDMVGAILQSRGNAAGDLDSETAEQGYVQADLAILWLSWYGLIADKEREVWQRYARRICAMREGCYSC